MAATCTSSSARSAVTSRPRCGLTAAAADGPDGVVTDPAAGAGPSSTRTGRYAHPHPARQATGRPDRLAQSFEPGERYEGGGEPGAAAVPPDHAALRRYLVENGFRPRVRDLLAQRRHRRCLTRRPRTCATSTGTARSSAPSSTGVTFTDVDLTEAVTRGAVFESCTFHTCRFNASTHVVGVRRVRLPALQLLRRDARRVQTDRVGLQRGTLRPISVRGGVWRGSASGRPVERDRAEDLDLREADLSMADLSGTSAGADLTGATLRRGRPHRHGPAGRPAGRRRPRERPTATDPPGPRRRHYLRQAHGAVVDVSQPSVTPGGGRAPPGSRPAGGRRAVSPQPAARAFPRSARPRARRSGAGRTRWATCRRRRGARDR